MAVPRRIVVGTAGHIDHGKSLLIYSLTGSDPDRLKEEKERGITIDLGFASLQLPDGTLVGFIDVPGHERFVRNMLAGVGGIDLVLLVVAADESIKPQTREHFEICRLLRIPRGIVVLTKSDLVDPEILDLVRLEVKDFLAGSFLEDAPLVAVSSRTGAGLDDLRRAIAAVAAEVPERPSGTVFRLPVDRSFSIRGFGTVVTGTLLAGRVSVGDELEILPRRMPAKVRGLEVFGRPCREAGAGQRTAVNLQGVEAAVVVRGDVLVSPGTFSPTRMIDVRIELLGDGPPLEDLTWVRLHHLSSEGMARVRLARPGPLAPGGRALAQLRLARPVAALPGDRFILRRPSPPATIGGGLILDNLPRKMRRAELTQVRLRMEALEHPDAGHRLREFIRGAARGGMDLPGLRARTGLEFPAILAALEPALAGGEAIRVPSNPPRFLDGPLFQAFLGEVTEALAVFHRESPLQVGVSKEEIRSRFFRREPGEVFWYFLEEAVRRRHIRVERDLVALEGHRVALQGAEAGALEKIEAAYRSGGLNPPEFEDIAAGLPIPRKRVEEIFFLLLKRGSLVRIKDERVFHAEAVEALKKRLWEYRTTSDTIDIATFKDLSGTSRKNAIPLLEHLDTLRVTRRDGHQRRILPPAGD